MPYRFGIGVMSKNIVDACITFANLYNQPLALIPSRRQVDYNGGYSGFTTESLKDYVKNNTKFIILQRDHGGPQQGKYPDDGTISLTYDCENFDVVHIDPFLVSTKMSHAIHFTTDLIFHCHRLNSDIVFEVGTEEAIFKYDSKELNHFLHQLRNNLGDVFNQIKYCVIQCGTALYGNTNTGKYNELSLMEMVDVCRKYNIISKEHNGDYQNKNLIDKKFSIGLETMNIAPEVAAMESELYYSYCNDVMKNKFFELCFQSGTWKKWLTHFPFEPTEEEKENLVKLSGHYVFNDNEFIKIKKQFPKNIDTKIVEVIVNSLKEKHGL